MKPDDSQHRPILAAPAARMGHSPELIAAVRHAQADMANLPPEIPGLTDKPPGLMERAGEVWANLRIGDEHFKSMWKLGFHELTAALVALPDSNIRPIEEPGVFGNEHMPHIQEHSHEYLASRHQDDDRSHSR